jgi:hypothetical protein
MWYLYAADTTSSSCQSDTYYLSYVRLLFFLDISIKRHPVVSLSRNVGPWCWSRGDPRQIAEQSAIWLLTQDKATCKSDKWRQILDVKLLIICKICRSANDKVSVLVFWVVTPCGLGGRHQNIRETYSIFRVGIYFEHEDSIFFLLALTSSLPWEPQISYNW